MSAHIVRKLDKIHVIIIFVISIKCSVCSVNRKKNKKCTVCTTIKLLSMDNNEKKAIAMNVYHEWIHKQMNMLLHFLCEWFFFCYRLSPSWYFCCLNLVIACKAFFYCYIHVVRIRVLKIDTLDNKQHRIVYVVVVFFPRVWITYNRKRFDWMTYKSIQWINVSSLTFVCIC